MIDKVYQIIFIYVLAEWLGKFIYLSIIVDNPTIDVKKKKLRNTYLTHKT